MDEYLHYFVEWGQNVNFHLRFGARLQRGENDFKDGSIVLFLHASSSSAPSCAQINCYHCRIVNLSQCLLIFSFKL